MNKALHAHRDELKEIQITSLKIIKNKKGYNQTSNIF